MAIAPAQTDASNAECVRHVFDLLNAHDVASLRQYWTEDTVDRFPDRTCRGTDEIAAYFEQALAALPDWHMEILSLVESGEEVYVRWRLTGTHLGSIMGIAPTGRRVALDVVNHFVLRHGKIASAFVVFDQLDYARQIGLFPPQGSAIEGTLKHTFNGLNRLLQWLRR